MNNVGSLSAGAQRFAQSLRLAGSPSPSMTMDEVKKRLREEIAAGSVESESPNVPQVKELPLELRGLSPGTAAFARSLTFAPMNVADI